MSGLRVFGPPSYDEKQVDGLFVVCMAGKGMMGMMWTLAMVQESEAIMARC